MTPFETIKPSPVFIQVALGSVLLLLLVFTLALVNPGIGARFNSLYRTPVSNAHVNVPSVSLPRVFFISETPVGGSLKYIQDLMFHYSERHGVSFHRLSNQAAILEAEHLFQEGDILVFQYLLNTDFRFADVTGLVRRFRLSLIIPIHDKYFLNDNPDADYAYHASLHNAEATQIPPDKLELLQMAKHIIFPSHFIYNIFLAHLNFPSMVVVPHIDQRLSLHLHVPALLDGTIRIGIITSPTYYKGLDVWESLFPYKEHNGLRILYYVYSHYENALFPHVMVRGGYHENEIYEKLEQDGIHGLLFLNNYPETYSYALTKGINSGRPLLYTSIGAVAERLAQFKQPDKYIATNNTDVHAKFRVLLSYIAVHAGQGDMEEDSVLRLDMCLVIPTFYDQLFLRKGPTSFATH